MKRFGDWVQYAGIAVLAAAVLLPFALPNQAQYRWWLVIAGVHLRVEGMLARSGALERLGAGSLFPTLKSAVDAYSAQERVSL